MLHMQYDNGIAYCMLEYIPWHNYMTIVVDNKMEHF